MTDWSVAGQVIDQAAETHRIVQNRYREGLTTITEVLRAETALLRARLNLVAARTIIMSATPMCSYRPEN